MANNKELTDKGAELLKSLALLDNVASRVNLSRSDHLAIQKEVKLLSDYIESKESTGSTPRDPGVQISG